MTRVVCVCFSPLVWIDTTGRTVEWTRAFITHVSTHTQTHRLSRRCLLFLLLLGGERLWSFHQCVTVFLQSVGCGTRTESFSPERKARFNQKKWRKEGDVVTLLFSRSLLLPLKNVSMTCSSAPDLKTLKWECNDLKAARKSALGFLFVLINCGWVDLRAHLLLLLLLKLEL